MSTGQVLTGKNSVETGVSMGAPGGIIRWTCVCVCVLGGGEGVDLWHAVVHASVVSRVTLNLDYLESCHQVYICPHFKMMPFSCNPLRFTYSNTMIQRQKTSVKIYCKSSFLYLQIIASY